MDVLDTDVIAELHRQPLQRFIATRDGLSRRLRAQGRQEVAEQVRRLRKPSTLLWALNQVGAIAPDDLEALFAAGDELRAAQARLLAGDRESAALLQDAGRRQRHLADVLARRAGMVLTAHDHAAPEPMLREMAAALASAALATADVRAALAGGWLLKEPGPAGFPAPDGDGDGDAAPVSRPEPSPAAGDAARIRAGRLEVNRLESTARLARDLATQRAAEAGALAEQARAAADAARAASERAEAAERSLRDATAHLETLLRQRR